MKEKTIKFWRRASLVCLTLLSSMIVLEASLDSEHDLVSMITTSIKNFIDYLNPKPEIPMTDISFEETPSIVIPNARIEVGAKAVPENCSDPTIKYRFSENITNHDNFTFTSPHIKNDEEDAWVEAYSETYNITKRFDFKIMKMYPNSDVFPIMYSKYMSNLIKKSSDETKEYIYDLRPKSDYFILSMMGSRDDDFPITEEAQISYDETKLEKVGNTCMYHLKDTVKPNEQLVINIDSDRGDANLHKKVKINIPSEITPKPIKDFVLVRSQIEPVEGQDIIDLTDDRKLIVNKQYRFAPLDENGELTRAYYQIDVPKNNITKDWGLFFNAYEDFDFVDISLLDINGNKFTKQYSFEHTYNKLNITMENLTYSDELSAYSVEAGEGARIIARRNDDSDYDLVTFTSSDPEILEIDNDGYIVAKQKGRVTVTMAPVKEGPNDISETFEIEVTGYEPTIKDENRFVKLMRKGMAHFAGFGVEGFLIASTLWLYTFKTKKLLHVLPSAYLFAGVTEIIQYFVPGRYCAFTDVVIDTLGAYSGAFIFLLIILISKLINYLIKRNKKE